MRPHGSRWRTEPRRLARCDLCARLFKIWEYPNAHRDGYYRICQIIRSLPEKVPADRAEAVASRTLDRSAQQQLTWEAEQRLVAELEKVRPAPLDGTDLNDDTRFESDSDCDGEDMADMLAQQQLEREAANSNTDTDGSDTSDTAASAAATGSACGAATTSGAATGGVAAATGGAGLEAAPTTAATAAEVAATEPAESGGGDSSSDAEAAPTAAATTDGGHVAVAAHGPKPTDNLFQEYTSCLPGRAVRINRYGLTAAATGNVEVKMVGYDDTNDYINMKSGAPLQQTIFAGMIVYQNPWSYQAPTWTHPESQENEDTPTTPALVHRNDPLTWHMCWLENGRHYDEFIDLLMHVNYRIQVDAFDRLTAAGALGFDAATYFGAPEAWPGGEANVNPGASSVPIPDFYFTHRFIGRSQLAMNYQWSTAHGDHGVHDTVNPPRALSDEQRTQKIFFGPVTGDGHGDHDPTDNPPGIGSEFDWSTNTMLF